MAQIRLVVNTDLKQAKAALDTLKTSFADLAKQLSTITVNKNLTAQLNALTKYYNSLSTAAQKVTTSTEKRKLAEQKLATEVEKTKTEHAKYQAQLERINKLTTSSATNIETLRKAYANLVNQLNTLQKQYASGTFDSTRESIEQNFESVKKLSQAQEVNGDEVKRLSGEYKKLAADVAQFRAEGEKLKTSDPFSPKQGDSIFRLQKQYASLLNSIKSAEQYYPKGTFDGIAKGAQEAVTGLQALGQEYTTTGTLSDASQKQLNTFSEGLNRQRAAFETTKNSAQNYHGTLRDIIQGFIKFQLAASIVMNSIQLIRGAFDSLNETLVETEKVVVSIQRVLDETVEGGKIADSLYDIAERLGQTFDNVQEIAQNFAKAGLSWQETLEATEAAVLALNVAELTAEESSEGLIAVMQQFNYEASELVNVIDVLNKAADKSAVDTQELLVALQKTGSYASAANLSLEQTVGLVSALSEATAASGQNIGNALKSLFSYTTRGSSLDTFASLSDEMNEVVEQYRLGAKSILDVWEQLSVEMQSLDAQQADALSQWTESSGLDAELEGELSEIYDSLTGVYDSAGVYRKNYFIALMNNFDEVQEVMGEISDAQGYTAEEQAKYMDTYEAKLNSLQAQWEHLANDEQGWLSFKKSLVEIASGFLQLIELTGGLRTTVIALGSILATVFGQQIYNGLQNFISALKNIRIGFTSAATAAQTFQSALGVIGLVATAISVVVGLIDQANSAIKQAREEAIAAWDEAEEGAKKLQELYNAYQNLANISNKTTKQEEEFSSINEQIIDQLGYRANKLKELTAGTEEYNAALKEVTETELRRYYRGAKTASNAALDEVASFDWDSGEYDISVSSGSNFHIYAPREDIFGSKEIEERFRQLQKDLKNSGFNVKNQNDRIQINGFLDENDPYSSLKNIDELLTWLEDYGYSDLGLYTNLSNYYSGLYDSVYQALESSVSAETYGALIHGDGNIDTQAEVDAIVNSVMSATGATEAYREEIEQLVKDTVGYNKELDETIDKTEEYKKTISTLKEDELDGLIDALEKAKNLEQESLDIEEKKRDVLEAQKRLQEAQNSLVKRFNAATGTYEWATDEQEVAEAEEDLQDAINNLNQEITDQVISELESGNATNESILSILQGIASDISDSQVSNWLNGIVDTIENTTGIDLGNVSFDSGGIANGLGFLPKATSHPEIVNDPALTAKILTPTSNAQFNRHVRDMGIMFEQARAYTQTPVLQSTIGNTTNNTTDNSIIINGMNLGSNMLDMTLRDVFGMMRMVPQNK